MVSLLSITLYIPLRANFKHTVLLLKNYVFYENCHGNKTNYVITDPLVFSVLIALLEYDDNHILKHDLTYLVDYELLNDFSREIQEKLIISANTVESKRLLALTTLSDSKKKSLLTSASLPRDVQARLGADSVELEMISSFNIQKNHHRKMMYLDSLTYIRSDKAIENIVLSLDQIDLVRAKYQKTYNFPYSVITYSLRKIYPHEKLFVEDCDEVYSNWLIDENPDDELLQKHKKYLNSVTKWAYKNHGVNLIRLKDAEFLFMEGNPFLDF